MTLRKFNNFLTVLVIGMSLLIMITPFLPRISYYFRDKTPEVVAPYAGELSKTQNSNSSANPPRDNRIVIPSIGLNEEIKQGSNIGLINDGGTWLRPNTAAPNENDNSVIVGHRFFGNSVATFYNLDKVEPGQYLAIYWEGEEHLYQVESKRVVGADAVEIEAPTGEKQLTIYTCDPVWTAANRLVLVAKPVEAEANS